MTPQDNRIEIIVLSPEEAVHTALGKGLEPESLRVVPARTIEEGLAAARSASAELLIVDSLLADPLAHAAKLVRVNPALGFMLIMSDQDANLAVEAARVGAYDFITRPLDPRKLRFRVRVALEKHSRSVEERAYRVALEERLNNRTEEVLVNRERLARLRRLHVHGRIVQFHTISQQVPDRFAQSRMSRGPHP